MSLSEANFRGICSFDLLFLWSCRESNPDILWLFVLVEALLGAYSMLESA
jgi:hypothetical protein